MSRAAFFRTVLVVCGAASASFLQAQYLFWHPPQGHKGYTAIYGEVTVLVDNPGVYYCACDWWPSAKGGGYTGIQDLRTKGKRIIFSVWDTGPELHPSVIAADSRTSATRFKGEGSGAHSHMQYEWQTGQTYRYYVSKRPDETGRNIVVSLYFFDETQQRWTLEGKILSPLADKPAVRSFDANLNSFLENLRDKSDKQREVPKLALYKLWVGTGPDDLHMVTSADGKPEWGTMNGAFFIGEGDRGALERVIKGKLESGQTYQFGERRVRLSIPEQRIGPDVLHALRLLK